MKTILLTAIITLFGVNALAEDVILTEADQLQTDIERMVEIGEIRHENSEMTGPEETILEHSKKYHVHGWYIGCASMDWRGYVYWNFGYNAYWTQGGAYNTCAYYSQYYCRNLGCQVYYY